MGILSRGNSALCAGDGAIAPGVPVVFRSVFSRYDGYPKNGMPHFVIKLFCIVSGFYSIGPVVMCLPLEFLFYDLYI